jgi:flagellar protein FlbD
MIHLTRLNHAPILLNSDLIEYVEKTPDTLITLTTGQKIIVLESPDEIVDLVVHFRRLASAGPILKTGKDGEIQ